MMFLKTKVGKKISPEEISFISLLVKDCSHEILLACFLLKYPKGWFFEIIEVKYFQVGNTQ